ncbi:hypothetical protein MTP04_24740 [Lysinibacillus sp. PLM2]|nr:hypothetical protein MTP04_24740 [Lysinibacillus sp. PLM2]
MRRSHSPLDDYDRMSDYYQDLEDVHPKEKNSLPAPTSKEHVNTKVTNSIAQNSNFRTGDEKQMARNDISDVARMLDQVVEEAVGEIDEALRELENIDFKDVDEISNKVDFAIRSLENAKEFLSN